MKVQLLFDVELNDKGEILEAGDIFEVVETWKQYEGFTAIRVNGVTEYFKSSCFQTIS
jgi:hypothetical protein